MNNLIQCKQSLMLDMNGSLVTSAGYNQQSTTRRTTIASLVCLLTEVTVL